MANAEQIKKAIAEFRQKYAIHPTHLWLAPWDMLKLLAYFTANVPDEDAPGPGSLYMGLIIRPAHYTAIGIAVEVE